MSDSLDVLLKRQLRCVIGKETIEILEPNIRQFFIMSSLLPKLLLSIRQIDTLRNKPIALMVYSIQEIVSMVSSYLKNIIDTKQDFDDNITIRQAIYIIYFMVGIYLDTKKLEESPSDNKSNNPYGLVSIFERFSAEYGWFPDEIFDRMTMRQFYLYWREQSERKLVDLETMAMMHGMKINRRGGSRYSSEKIPRGVRKINTDEVSTVLQINEGEFDRLKKLLMYMGMPYPQDLDFKVFEPNLRNILHLEIKQLKEKGKWTYPDYDKDIFEQVTGINSSNVDEIIKLAGELGMKIAPNFDFRNHKHLLLQSVCITIRRKQKYLENITVPKKEKDKNKDKRALIEHHDQAIARQKKAKEEKKKQKEIVVKEV
jgi:hypothetical protein